MPGLLSAVETERDASLLGRHRAGDPTAFGELYQLHYDRLVRYLRHRVRDWHVAEEIAQDTFVRAYGAAAHLKDDSRFYPWLTVIAQRLAIDWFRRSGRVSLVAELDRELGEEAPADEGVIAACEAEAVGAAMGRVRERHRQVLRWQNEGMSYEDIAERLNAPLTTVPPLLFRARQALRREYLALMETERIAAVPVLGALVAWSRRWRARGLVIANYAPDPAMLTAQIAGVVLVVAGVVGPFAGAAAVHGSTTVGFDRASTDGAPGTTVGTGRHGWTSTAASEASDGSSGMSQGRPLVERAMPYVRLDGAEHNRAKERARREALYYVEFGDTWIALDPHGDAQRTVEMADSNPSLGPSGIGEEGR